MEQQTSLNDVPSGWQNGLTSDLSEILFSADVIQQRVAELGRLIEQDYRGQDLLVICVLNGAAMVVNDLIRQINLPLEVDYIGLSSYGSGVHSSGLVSITKDLDRSIEGRNVLIVDDIADTVC